MKKRNGSVRKMYEAESIAATKAKEMVEKLSDKEKLLIISSLYWAEGTKKDFSFSNSDVEMIKLFINGVTSILRVPKWRIKINIRIFEDMDKEKCVNYWLKSTSLTPANISSVNILKGKKLGKLEYGMCRVRVAKGSYMLKYLKAIKNQFTYLFSLP